MKSLPLAAAFLLIFAANVSAGCPNCGNRRTASYQPPHHRPPSPYYGTAGTFAGGGYGYPGSFAGYGYSYDPYATGRFRAPDLLEEPIFQAQHRYESAYRGRRGRRPKLQFKHPAQGYGW